MRGNLDPDGSPLSPTTGSRRAVVVGAGAVGLAAALGLARSGLAVTLVGPPSARRDGRTAALLGGSVALMERLGVWTSLAPEAAPLAAMRIVDDTGSLFRPPSVTFRASEIGLAAFGHNVENATLAERLAEAVRAELRIAWHEDLAGGLAGPGRIALADGGEIAADLVVAADGRASPLRTSAGIRTRSWSYDQRALTTLLAHERPHEDVSTEFHTRGGPFTLVPLPGRRSSLVWVMPPSTARRIAALPPAALAGAVERQSQGLLGRIAIDGPVATVPLGAVATGAVSEPRLALVGEAAHALPPIGAQGLNLGFADVAALLDAVADAPDPGDERVLAAYARRRRGDVALRTVAVDALNRSLLLDLLPIDAARGLGLAVLGRLGPLRRAVMRAGFAGGMPAGRP